MTGPDPFEVLGLTRAATIDDVRSARRRLAFVLHPDRGGDQEQMQAVNVAFEACVAHITNRRPLPPMEPTPTPTPESGVPGGRRPEPQRGGRPPAPGRRRRFIEHDEPSFTVDALPAETFEALLVVASWIGEVLDDDPPYVLECHLTEPAPCWCRLSLVPDAGGSTVSILVVRSVEDPGAGAHDEPEFVEQVRDVWVEHLNSLGRQQP